MNLTRLSKAVAITALLTLPLTSAKCPITATDNVDVPCNPEDYIPLYKDTTLDPGGHFYVEAPPAENDCHGYYVLQFRYKDDGLALLSDRMPPIEGLPTGFGPAGEFSYFPHALPKLVMEDGFHIWEIDFHAGNKDSPYPSTEHSINFWVPTVQDSSEAQPIKVHVEIAFRPLRN